jgi:hypothetical protein
VATPAEKNKERLYHHFAPDFDLDMSSGLIFGELSSDCRYYGRSVAAAV